MPTIVERFTDTYNRLNVRSLGLLTELYSEDILFQDPFRHIAGLAQLTEYFTQLYRHVESVSFRFGVTVTQDNNAVLVWTMALRHPRLNGGSTIMVPGVSHIRFHDKVSFHRDYFDAGAMLYEQLPLLGTIIRRIKARV